MSDRAYSKGHVWQKTRDGMRADFTARHNEDYTDCGPICVRCGYSYDSTRRREPDRWCPYGYDDEPAPTTVAPRPVPDWTPSAELGLAAMIVVLTMALGSLAWWVYPTGVALLLVVAAIWLVQREE